MKSGLLITCEGIDGAGKSTICTMLAQELTALNIPVILTKEPGGTPLGKELRNITQHHTQAINPTAEFLLFASDRAQHVATVVKPALAAGTVVISDRMGDSSLAYQGYGRGLSTDMILQVNTWAMAGCEIDLTLYLALDPAVAHERITARNHDRTRFEQEQEAFWSRVVHGFDTIFAQRTNVIRLDATQQPSSIIQTILAHPLFIAAQQRLS